MQQRPVLSGVARWRAKRDGLEPVGGGRWVAAGGVDDPAIADDDDDHDQDVGDDAVTPPAPTGDRGVVG